MWRLIEFSSQKNLMINHEGCPHLPNQRQVVKKCSDNATQNLMPSKGHIDGCTTSLMVTKLQRNVIEAEMISQAQKKHFNSQNTAHPIGQ
ncbi:hypothetical protein AVEN_29117-1 [Araneus ventricosus]|uniref:Uncharacterized protein n=1 Tax=Araneus ventricosus TaxID=182803 RepID=A0A4Y2AJV5_ARAVE|nr:hypothetical protein AVEN_29117-1 [Araneus ventricosus]